ncbi:MAG: hypothetical protein AB7Q17_14680 [Phycisphaerae bacterium]
MLLAQVGYGPGEKVDRGLEEGSINGAILSPKDAARDRLEECVRKFREEHADAVLMMDPQFYVTTLNVPRDGRLPEYDYYADHAGLSRIQFSPRQVARYVKACLDYQREALEGVNYLVSPNILFDDFRDLWSQIALNMAEGAVEYHGSLDDPPPLLVSIVTSEVALRNATGLAEFLDAISSLDAHGFYLLIHRNSSSYEPAMEPGSMENLLYLVHVLSRLNDYEVFVGYSDWIGAFLHAAGATGTASGWHQSLRQFSMARFEPAAGGRRPRKRYSSAPMLSSPLIQPELEDIFRAGRIGNVLTETAHDAILRNGPAAGVARWTDQISCLAHWGALNRVIETVSTGRAAARLDAAIELIDGAESLYDRLAQRGVNFEPATGPGHLTEWRNAIDAFRRNAEV